MTPASELARNALFSVAAGVWIGSIAWVIADARSRLPKAGQVRAATALVALLPVGGLLLWLLARPAQTLTERWSDELCGLLSWEAAETGNCPVCRTHLERDFHSCPGCGVALEQPGADRGTPEPDARLRAAAR